MYSCCSVDCSQSDLIRRLVALQKQILLPKISQLGIITIGTIEMYFV